MSNFDEIRWQQRLSNFEKAMTRLTSACAQEEYSELEQAGLVHLFEVSFELSWKVLKDRLFYEGYDEPSPRSVFRKAFEVGYLDERETEILLDALGKRNLLSHTYDESVANEAVELITQQYEPTLRGLLKRLKTQHTSA